MRTALLLLFALACQRQVTTAPNPRDAIVQRDLAWVSDTLPVLRFNTPYSYGALRVQAEQCSGRTRAGWPRFYVASISPFPGMLLAFFEDDPDDPDDRIVFALGYETDDFTVVHELLHWLLAPVVSPKWDKQRESYEAFIVRVHPAEYFGKSGRCAHLLYPGT
jgi:hypothetical protein